MLISHSSINKQPDIRIENRGKFFLKNKITYYNALSYLVHVFFKKVEIKSTR
jgi:hypothetical protein